MSRIYIAVVLAALAAAPASAAVRVNPDGVNVNTNGATTVFLTFGGLANQRAAEATWCGELIPAAPDLGVKCDPSTIFGRLPARFDQSTTSGVTGFTDIMSIPPSVARRARQAAETGARSSFFYVRRFVSLSGGPDEYVAVTCRLAGGGARVPFSLTDVRLRFDTDEPVLFVKPGTPPPPVAADITFNGTGRLKGRWEVVVPGDELPEPRDLLTEATLPIEERGRQRRYAELGRFNIFLPPTGRVTLPGPDITRMPTAVEGAYLLLLRIEATDDKEADSNLGTAGAGAGVVHSGGVAGFPLPPLRYVVGSSSSAEAARTRGSVLLLLPAAAATVPRDTPLTFRWADIPRATLYRLEVQRLDGQPVHAALVQPRVGIYVAPPFITEKAGDGYLRWRVVALGPDGGRIDDSGWRDVRLGQVANGGGGEKGR